MNSSLTELLIYTWTLGGQKFGSLWIADRVETMSSCPSRGGQGREQDEVHLNIEHRHTRRGQNPVILDRMLPLLLRVGYQPRIAYCLQVLEVSSWSVQISIMVDGRVGSREAKRFKLNLT